MNIIEPIRMGLDQLRVHKLRAMLSILGILISVGSVTGIVSMGDGLRITVMREFERMGGPSFVKVHAPPQWYRKENRWVRRDWEEYLDNHDVEYILSEVENVEYVVPEISADRTVKYRDAATYAQIRASNEHYHKTQSWNVESGRFITEMDVRNASKVAVIGPGLAKDLYGEEDPVGRELKVEGTRFLVVGVLSELKFFGNTNERNAVVPITTVQKRFFGNDRVEHITVKADSPEFAESVAQKIRPALKRFHEHGEDFIIETGESEIGRFNRVVTILKIVAGGIAGISLLVGGIGIMNIMLVSVSERTREIGIRKAVGAKRLAILWQFLLESIVLCMFGGALGVVLGLAIGAGITAYLKSLTPLPFKSIITPGLMAFAILYSAVIGIFFGVYPAYRASKLDPIEALRHE